MLAQILNPKKSMKPPLAQPSECPSHPSRYPTYPQALLHQAPTHLWRFGRGQDSLG